MRHLIAVFALATGLSTVASASIHYTVSGDFTNVNSVVVNETTFTDSSGFFSLSYGISLSAASNFVTTFPTGENYGFFTVACPSCTGAHSGTFPAFTIVLTITDTDTGGVGQFTGTSSGGAVSFDPTGPTGSANVIVNWTPLQLGPSGNNLNSGSFGLDFFTISTPSILVDPTVNSGVTTIQGLLFENSAVPEPATFAVMGFGLIGMGTLLRRKRS